MSASEAVTPVTTIKNTILLSLCVSIGFALITEYAGMCPRDGNGKPILDEEGKPEGLCPPIDLQQFIDENQAEAESVADSEGFNVDLIFGDFLRITQAIINGIAFQYIIGVLDILGFNSTFVLGMRAVGAVFAIFSVYYLISGRQM